ncbi:MAG: UvrD-helicase domain-containing protein [Nitrospirae bacterium]|nr:UvrD-helicase domain-containing protein [Nitrospirota bacterium]
MTFLPDRAARERAATATDCNLVVTAGAGTGKTTLLVDRLLHLLLRQPDPLAVGEIVALTFTNKAASEMKLRLRDRLAVLLELDAGTPPAAARRRDWDQMVEILARYSLSKARLDELATTALQELEKSQIGTIHSFAAHLLRLYPIESFVDPVFHEDEGDQFKHHFNQEWALWLDEELGHAGMHHDVWKAALQSLSLGDVKELAAGLAGELVPLDEGILRGVAQGESGSLPPPIRAWMTGLAERATVLRGAHAKTNTLERMLDEAVSFLQGAAQEGLPLTPGFSSGEEAGGEEGKEGGDGLDRSVPPITTTWSKEEYEEAKGIIRVAQALLNVEAGPLIPLLRLLIPFAKGCRRRFVQSGYVSFDGLLARARDLLRDHPMIRRELKKQFKSILVDEFQDTDPVQYEMILYLAEAAGREEREWRRVRLEPGKLFIVGDPKQSIYAFRRADMDAYDAVVEDYVLAQDPPGERHVLHSNFRSHSALLSPINAVFARVFPEAPIKGLQPKNDPLLAVHADAPPLSVERLELRLVRPQEPDADADAAGRAEAEELARWLREEVLDREEIRERDVPTKIKPRHVAILLRTLTKARDYLEALRRYDIPCLTEGEKHFYERQEIIDAVNLLRAAVNPHDALALVGVLRSSLGGLSDSAIEALAREGLLDYRRIVSAEAGHAVSVAPLYVLIAELHRELPIVPLPDVMDVVLSKAPLLELAAASMDHEQAVANLLKLRDIVAQCASRPDLTLPGLIAELTSRALEPPDETESPLAEDGLEDREQQGAVRLLSIHKAKGLEFPMVILAGIHRGTDRRESRILVQHDWSTGVVGMRVGELQTAGGVYVGHKLAQRQRAEQARVLYVAMTRAKRRLVLSAGLPAKSRGGESFLSRVAEAMDFDLAAIETSTIRLGEAEVPIQVVPGRDVAPRTGATEPRWREAEGDLGACLPRWSERVERWQAAKQTRLFMSPTALEEATTKSQGRASPSGSARATADAETSRLVGILAHRVLEGWEFTDDLEKLYVRVAELCRKGMSLESHVAVDVEQIEAELRGLFETFAASSSYAELRRTTILGREVPFAMPWEGDKGRHEARRSQPCIMEGVIDLVYRLDGRVWIADYKTDRVADEELEARAAGYRVQAQIYREAVARSVGAESVGVQFLFLRNGRAVQA